MTSLTHHHRPTGAGAGGGVDRTRTDRPELGGLGAFGGVLLLLLGFFNLLDGIAAVNHSRVFTANATFVVGDLRVWGWTVIGLAVLMLLAGISVLRGGEWGRWFGVVVLSLNALAQMFAIPAYPVWSVLIIAVDIVAIYGLAVHAGRRMET